jgi:hypothetical protein
MLFLVTWTFTDQSEDGGARSLTVFQNWQPPAGVEFKGFYGYVEGSGGAALIDTNDAAALARTMAPFTPWMVFEARPLLPIEESAAVDAEAVAFRAGIA